MKTNAPKRITTPLMAETIEGLRAGDRVLLSGVIYTARDTAHKRMIETLESGGNLPIEINMQVLYYCGPTPASPGRVIGSAGPTTSSRMDTYTPALLAKGLKGMIGKGRRSDAVKSAMRQYGAVYFGATGGAGALLSKAVRACEITAYGDLGTEAIMRLVVEDFPLVVINDVMGNDLYEMGTERYRE